MPWPFAVGEILTAANLNAATVVNNALCQVVTPGTEPSINDSVSTELAFAGVDEIDPLGWHNPATNNARVMPTIAGWYRVTAAVDWQDDGDYTNLILQLRRNGAVIAGSFALDMPQGDVSNFRASVAFPLVQLNGTTDYVSLFVFQSNTSAGANTLNARMLVELVFPT